MAIIGEMNGIPLDDLVYRKENEGGGSPLRVEIVSNSYEGIFDEILKRFVASHDCVDIKVVRYDRSQGYKAVVVYREAKREKRQ